MPRTEADKLADILAKLALELCKQSTGRQKTETANNKKIAKILGQGAKLDPGLRDLDVKFGQCCILAPGRGGLPHS